MKTRNISLLLFFAIFVVNGVCFAPAPDIGVTIEPESIEAGSSGTISVDYRFPEGMHQTLQKDYFLFEIDPIQGFTLGEIAYPAGEPGSDGIVHYQDKATLTASLTIADDVEPQDYEINVIASYQLCYDESGTCTMPGEQEFAVPITVMPGGKSPLLMYLFFALLGGFILNLTPCVLPVLSLRAFSLINQSQSDRKMITLNSLIYSVGILFSFLVMAVIIILMKTTGQLVGWGFQFQNPIFVLAMTSVLFVFSLSLFDVFTIFAPNTSVAGKLSSKEGPAGAFFMGIFAVLLGTPCTAPMLGAALAFAFAQPAVTILLMFSFIGIGMAIPFLLIAISPGIVKKLPKPGEWMNILKELMGFLLLLWAVKMLDVLYYQIGGSGVISFIFFLLALALAFRIIGRFVRPGESILKNLIAIVVALLIIVGVGMKTLTFSASDTSELSDSDLLKGRWQQFSPERITELREGGVPVFIDFTAKWCTTCYTNKQTVLYASDIQQAFEEKGVELFVADFTSYDEVIAEWIKKFDKAGVPVNVFYIPGEEEPIVLPEILNKRMVFDALDKID